MTTSPTIKLPDLELTWKPHEGASASPPPRAGQLLRQSPIPALRRLRVEETDFEVAIDGTVASYYLKQLAQETLMPVLGGRGLLNRVTVVRS